MKQYDVQANNEYVEYLRATGRYDSFIADMRAVFGWNNQEIAEVMGTTRQNIDRIISNHGAKLKVQSEQAKYLTARKVGRPKKEK